MFCKRRELFVLESVAKRVSSYLLKSEILEDETAKEIFEYRFHRFLSMSISILPLVLLSILFQTIWETGLYLLFFFLLRSASGGWHSDSSLMCWTTFQCCYLVLILTGTILPPHLLPGISFLFLAFSIGIIARYAPLNHPNLDLSASETKALHKKSIMIVLVESAFLGFLALQGVQGAMLYYPSFAIFSVSAFILFGKVVKQDIF